MSKRIRPKRSRSDEEKHQSKIRARLWLSRQTSEKRLEIRNRSKEWRKNNRTKFEEKRDNWHRTHRHRQYGMTPVEFEGMVKQCNGRCAICRENWGIALVVDHDHKTEKVRGLLCRNCNVGLGFFLDSLDILESAKAYLRGTRS